MSMFNAFALNGRLYFLRSFLQGFLAHPTAIAVFALSLVALAFGTHVPCAQAKQPVSKVLRLANGEWPPYTGQHLPGFGCDSQVVSEAFSMVGIQVDYVFLPWARGMLLSRNGVLDGAIEWAETPEHRKSHFISNQPLSKQDFVFFYRKGSSLDWQKLEDLHNQRIGLTIGYVYYDLFKAMQRKYPAVFSEAASDVLNFRKLLSRRIDLFPIEKTVGQYLLKSKFSAQEQAALAIHPKPINEFKPHLLLSRVVKGNEQRMQLFEQGLQQLQASGRYAAIMAGCSYEIP
nr:transporter substrate-binding domain-containing protein [uncultured Desulfobulbus sp.]